MTNRIPFNPFTQAIEVVLHAAVLQLSNHLQPELGTFSLREPQAQQLLIARQIDTQRLIHAFDFVRARILWLDAGAVQINDWIQRTVGRGGQALTSCITASVLATDRSYGVGLN